jgi:hypothetical protein
MRQLAAINSEHLSALQLQRTGHTSQTATPQPAVEPQAPRQPRKSSGRGAIPPLQGAPTPQQARASSFNVALPTAAGPSLIGAAKLAAHIEEIKQLDDEVEDLSGRLRALPDILRARASTTLLSPTHSPSIMRPRSLRANTALPDMQGPALIPSTRSLRQHPTRLDQDGEEATAMVGDDSFPHDVPPALLLANERAVAQTPVVAWVSGPHDGIDDGQEPLE